MSEQKLREILQKILVWDDGNLPGDVLDEAREALAQPAAGVELTGWQPIETAPKGAYSKYRTDPQYVNPPKILLLFSGGETSVGYWDFYYAEGGSGYEGGLAWVDQCSGERLDLHYDAPTHWMQLPAPPSAHEAKKSGGAA